MKKKNTSPMRGRKPRMLMVIDGSNLAHRSYHKFKNLKSNNGSNTGLVYGFLRILNSYLVRFKPSHLVIIFDTHESKQSNFRNNLIEGYKAHRSKITMDYEDFNKQTRLLRRILRLMGVQMIMDKKGLGHESDDYIAWLVINHPGKSIIISSDKDFCQLLSNKVKIFNPSKEIIIHPQTCKDIMGYSPEECVDYLILNGDKSDDIPGYYGMGEVKTKGFLNLYTSIEAFLNDPEVEFKGINKDQLEKLYQKNRPLIDLRTALTMYPIKKIPWVRGCTNSIRREKLFKVLDKYTLRSFKIPDFLEPFTKLQRYVERL